MATAISPVTATPPATTPATPAGPNDQQITRKVALFHAAAVLAAASIASNPLPAGATDAQVSGQLFHWHCRWYRDLSMVALPDETVYTSPPAPTGPAGGVPGAAVGNLATLAQQLLPLILPLIPGAAPAAPIVAAITAALPNLSTLPSLSTGA